MLTGVERGVSDSRMMIMVRDKEEEDEDEGD